MSQQEIHIDGAKGEGGGQILRTALALSMITGKPFRIDQIRAGRAKPGLLRQHLVAAQASAALCNAKIDGDQLGSTAMSFSPGPIKTDEFCFKIGTAGSTALVLQTLLPALMTADDETKLTIEGGTHNLAAPSFEFLQHAYAPLLKRMGCNVELNLDRPGFYPAGGGRINATIRPARKLQPLTIHERGKTVRRHAVALIAGLPGSIAVRELNAVKHKLGWTDDECQIEQLNNALSHGNTLNLVIESDWGTEVFTSIGRRGVSAKVVAHEAIEQVRSYLQHDQPIGPHLADQLMLLFAIAGSGSFRTGPLTPHAQTNRDIIQQFLDIDIRCTTRDNHIELSFIS